MNHSDFHIGLVFMDCTGWWRCTDVGARTILAIRLDHDDPHWYEGPPYIIKEDVFDEDDIARCHLTVGESIRAAVHAAHTSVHPGFPHEVVTRMMEIRHAHPYPNEGVLRFDRKRPDGEVLHPFAGRKEADSWVVEVYLPFEAPTRQWSSATSSRYRELRRMTSEQEQTVRQACDAESLQHRALH